MPLKKWSSKKTISSNIKELMTTKPWKTRAKGIATIAKTRDISPRKAEQIQSVAIALNKAWKSKPKTTRQKINSYVKKVVR